MWHRTNGRLFAQKGSWQIFDEKCSEADSVARRRSLLHWSSDNECAEEYSQSTRLRRPCSPAESVAVVNLLPRVPFVTNLAEVPTLCSIETG